MERYRAGTASCAPTLEQALRTAQHDAIPLPRLFLTVLDRVSRGPRQGWTRTAAGLKAPLALRHAIRFSMHPLVVSAPAPGAAGDPGQSPQQGGESTGEARRRLPVFHHDLIRWVASSGIELRVAKGN